MNSDQNPVSLIVGLGNPGNEYARTRHNAGFMALDILATVAQPNPAVQGHFELHKKSQTELCKVDAQHWLAKPQQFMNNSGKAVRSLIEFFSLYELQQDAALNSLFVVHDDLDLELGTWKMQFGTGPKIHNGLLSLYQHLGTRNFWHVRIGVDGRGGSRTMPGSNYVLAQFEPAQMEKLRITLGQVALKLL